MATQTISQWTPFGVALNITATSGTVTRRSATQYAVQFTVSWKTYWPGSKTNYGMTASSGGNTATINYFGNSKDSGQGSFTGYYSISGNGSATKSVTVTFRNFNDDNGDSATKTITLSVSVPAWTSYTVTYNANGGTGAPAAQTKWKDQTLTLSSTIPTRAGHNFAGWGTSADDTSVNYPSSGSYTSNASITLYAIWTKQTYTVTYNANGGSGAPGKQTKTYGTTLTLSTTTPTRTNYAFKGWGTSAGATTVAYAAGGSYTSNASITLYAIWEVIYSKPKISNLTANRCDSSGALVDDGTCAHVKFTWSTVNEVSSIKVSWTGTDGGAMLVVVPASGTGGNASYVISDSTFDADTSYLFTVTVSDGSGSGYTTSRDVTMSSAEFHIDAGEHSVAIGKTAETLLDSSGKPEKTFDVKWRSAFRNTVCVGDKMWYHDGKQGIFLSWEGFMHLQRTTAQGNHPYIGFYLDNATTQDGLIRLNSSTKVMEFLNAAGYKFGGNIELAGHVDFANNKIVYALDPNGVRKEIFRPQSSSSNTALGSGNYTNKSGNTLIYGHDIQHYVSNVASSTNYRPYRRQGDSQNVTLRTSGYVTNSGQDVSFWIPFTEPIIGSPTVTVTSRDGFVLRQGTKYTHGSGASTNVSPDSYEATLAYLHGVYVKAVFSNTTNVTNNDAIGIYWDGTITFS